MKPIEKNERLVANIYKDDFTMLPDSTGKDIGQSILQLNKTVENGVGFHVYRMAPGMTTETHMHTSHEEFFVLEGDITDNDGTEYVAGDLVLAVEDPLLRAPRIAPEFVLLLVAYE